MSQEPRLCSITPDNVEDYDLFCWKSKKKKDEYQDKLKWFNERYEKGLRMKLLHVDEGKGYTSRGFIEYIPAEEGWRVVSAPNHLLIHCTWVVGRWKKKGFGSELIQSCIQEADEAKMDGVVVVASSRNWLAGSKLFLKNGFSVVDSAPPSFELLSYPLKKGKTPSFPANWDERQKSFGKGMTVIYSSQCPYQPDALRIFEKVAYEKDIQFKAIKFESAKDLQTRSPTPYGVFGVVLDGKLLTYCYEKEKDIISMIDERKTRS